MNRRLALKAKFHSDVKLSITDDELIIEGTLNFVVKLGKMTVMGVFQRLEAATTLIGVMSSEEAMRVKAKLLVKLNQTPIKAGSVVGIFVDLPEVGQNEPEFAVTEFVNEDYDETQLMVIPLRPLVDVQMDEILDRSRPESVNA